MALQIDIRTSGRAGLENNNYQKLIVEAVKTTVFIAGLGLPDDAELSVLLSDDETLQALNLKWRGKDRATNVLSFPGQTRQLGMASGPMLGDIVISMETTSREAAIENKSVNHHLSHLIVHGFLHLFGYDHENDEKAIQMEGLERKVLAELGIDDPYTFRQC